MLSGEFWIGTALIVLMVLATTANVAIRHVSRVDLAGRLSPPRRDRLLEAFQRHEGDLLFITSFLRMGAVLGLTLLIAHAMGAGPSNPRAAAGYVEVFLTALVLVMTFGVAIPTAWAHYRGDAFMVAALAPLLGLRILLMPVTVVHHVFDVLGRRLAGVPAISDADDEAAQIEKEILGVVSEGERAGAVREQDAELIESVMAFRDTEVAKIMTPRTEIVALPLTAGLQETKDVINREGHSRIPLYGENLDDIRGVLYAKDLLKLAENEPFEAVSLMRKVPFVPESKPISDLLQELRERKVHLAIVLDEYGGTAGLVTIEDILEELVGEIADEYEAPEPEPIQRISPTVAEVDARVHIDELNEALGIELPEDEDYDTVGGFMFSRMGKIPAAGEELACGNVRLRVVQSEERRINRLRVEIAPP